MFRITQNLWFDELRAGRRREIATSNAKLDCLAGGDSQGELTARLELGAVRRHIARLPPEQRVVLLLISIEGLRYKEAAAVLDVPIGTAGSGKTRAWSGAGAQRIA